MSKDVWKRLGRLPKGLSQSYNEIYEQSLEEYESEDRKRLDLVLSLLLTPYRPRSPEAFIRFVFWDGEEEDEEDGINHESISTLEKDTKDQTRGDSTLEDSEIDCECGEEEAFEDSKSSEDERKFARNRHRNSGSSTLPPSEITRLCFNLVIFDNTTQAFRFAHTSVQDYLQLYNPRYKNLSECHARLAERCILVLLHEMRHSERRFLRFPVESGESSIMRDPKIFKANFVEDRVILSRYQRDDLDEAQDQQRPIHIKVDQSLIRTDVLDIFELPWERDQVRPPFHGWVAELILITASFKI